jgi:hypothetical protein
MITHSISEGVACGHTKCVPASEFDHIRNGMLTYLYTAVSATMQDLAYKDVETSAPGGG